MRQAEGSCGSLAGDTVRLLELTRKLPRERKQVLIRLLETGQRMDQRQFSRQACSIAAGGEVMGRKYRGVLQNMSAGGAFIRTWKSLFPGQRTWVSFSLTGFAPVIRVCGEVVHAGESGAGIRFVWHPRMPWNETAGIRA